MKKIFNLIITAWLIWVTIFIATLFACFAGLVKVFIPIVTAILCGISFAITWYEQNKS